MAWINIIKEKDAAGVLAKVYSAAAQRAGRVYNILRVQSQTPEVLKGCMDLYAAIMRGESSLTRRQREMIAVVVSKTNNCHY